jgi:hypothetical protein
LVSVASHATQIYHCNIPPVKREKFSWLSTKNAVDEEWITLTLNTNKSTEDYCRISILVHDAASSNSNDNTLEKTSIATIEY